jgi:hypothetical protein
MFENIAQVWMHWSVRTFKYATSMSSLEKAKSEIEELKIDLQHVSTSTEKLHEYADIILCVLHSAAKEGFNVQQVVKALREKTSINYQREWDLDHSGNTYSHKKQNS